MSVKILCRKVPNLMVRNNYFTMDRFFVFNNRLTELVQNANGFIGSESYYNHDLEGFDSVMTISKWDRYSNWDDWYNSDTRKELKKEYEDILFKDSYSVLRKSYHDEVFLL